MNALYALLYNRNELTPTLKRKIFYLHFRGQLGFQTHYLNLFIIVMSQEAVKHSIKGRDPRAQTPRFEFSLHSSAWENC